jgi:ribonuclease inhibitor
MVKRCILEGAVIQSEDAFYAALERGLSGMPPSFGRNLDALWDALTRDVEGPFTIEWRDVGRSAQAIGPRHARIVEVLREAASARADFTLVIAGP